MSRWDTADLIRELDHLAGTDSPEHICRRLNTTPAAVAKAARKAGRPDLATPFDRIRSAQRTAA